MTNQAIPVTSLSSPPVSRWLGFFPEFRDDSLGFLLRCHAYGDVVKLPTILPDPLMTLKPKIPVRMTIESVGTPERHPTTV